MMCPDVEFSEQLYRYIKEDIIGLKTEDIKKMYNYWRQGDIGPGEIYKKERRNIADGQDVPENAELLGVDFPTWFNTPDGKLRIMIIGRDPQRDKSVFEKLNVNQKEKVIIGSPYGFHIPVLRIKDKRQYWPIVERLSKAYFIYLTDAYKTFFKVYGQPSHIYYRKKGLNSTDAHSELLRKEIELIKPDLIVTLGVDSHAKLLGKKTVKKLSDNIDSNVRSFGKDQIPVLPMLHLSRSVRDKYWHNFLKANGQEGKTKVEGAYNIVNTFIKKHF